MATGRLAPNWKFHLGLLLAGWGAFNVVEGLVNHQLLGVHHVRDDKGAPLSWDLGFLAFGALLIAAIAYPAGMGMGDVKLAGVMGLYLGLSVAPALLIAFLVGSAVGIAIMVRHGAGARKKGVPFAPFLALGGLVGLLAGNDLIDLYTRTFL